MYSFFLPKLEWSNFCSFWQRTLTNSEIILKAKKSPRTNRKTSHNQKPPNEVPQNLLMMSSLPIHNIDHIAKHRDGGMEKPNSNKIIVQW
jgi:hypothetical protein